FCPSRSIRHPLRPPLFPYTTLFRSERAGHVAFGAFAGAAGMLGAVWFSAHGLIFASLCLACSGIYAALAVFWTLPSSMLRGTAADRKSTRLNSSHSQISYAVFCLKK